MKGFEGLKLRLEDADDLEWASVHLQDSILRLQDMRFLPRQHRFAVLLNRFCWVEATRRRLDPPMRVNAGLHFESVRSVSVRGIDQERKGTFLVLLAVRFAPEERPGGQIILDFAGGGTVSLDVECIEGALQDRGLPWRTPRRPDHKES